ncbi:hypothetical protein [Exercitatus varius]|uniref:hypothetical protein n=1 Tax=Exercitatus varius TaxID=67857 RepID=UPI00294B8A4F|nr:hypothetical protein [Exercitatus varius]MDG2961741.1 hypothetical protein [Exercitatus varius]
MSVDINFMLTDKIYENMRTPLFLKAIQQPPEWANDEILAWDQQYFNLAQAFMRHHYWTSQGSINVFRVVGTAHQQYQHRPWLDLLTSGKRMDINLPLQQKKPEYYREVQPKVPMMYFNTLDGIHYYVGADGNHRTCIAKFMFYETGETQLHGVTINHYDIHNEFYQLFRQLQSRIKQLNLSVVITPVSTLLKREDTAGWMTDYFETYLLWQEYNEVENTEHTEQLDYEQAQQKFFELSTQFSLKQQNVNVQKSFWKKIFLFK